MPKKSKSSRRASSRNKRAHSRRQTQRKRGGADALDGASVKYSLAGSWPSRMSLGQGQDYFKYHVGQHGGASYDYNHGGAPLRAISHSSLPDGLRDAAHVNGLDRAIEYSRQFKDPNQAGGRRRRTRRKGGKRGKKNGKKNGKKHGKSHRKSHNRSRRTHRKRGGDLGYSPFPGKGMLLDSSTAYAQAGLNPQWKTDVAFDMAKVRDTQ